MASFPGSGQPPPCAHRMTYRVCYGDTDRMGRVYYANYLVFLERARTEMLRDCGHPYLNLEQAGLFLPVREVSIRYGGWFTYDDELVLASWLTQVRNARLTVASAIFREDAPTLSVRAIIELACIDGRGKPTPLPSPLVEDVSRFLFEETTS